MDGLCGWVLVTGCNIENVLMPLNCTLQNGLFFYVYFTTIKTNKKPQEYIRLFFI